MCNIQEPIDIVIAWVDGSDSELKQKRMQYQKKEQIEIATVEETRFAHNNEIYFCVASILKYVPYAGTIYIITDNQKPEWIDEFARQGLCDKEKIKIIDHKEIFHGYEKFLPTFNSLSIESMIWNIKGLSNYFIYLNDDFFFNCQSSSNDFIEDGKVIIYGHWKNIFFKKIKYLLRLFLSNINGREAKPKYTTAQVLSADMLGLNKYYEVHHRPHLLNKHSFAEFFKLEQELLAQQIRFKFRNIKQFLPVGLSNHLAIQKNTAILKSDIKIAYLKNENSVASFLDEIENPNIKYGCIQSLDLISPTEREKVQRAMLNKFSSYLPKQLFNDV